ncbi:MAG TPA: hypothetical protein VNH11_15515 [Pirellulales bacterium]|nr:hypothetical protein [Pirellulales bacterium]
MSVRIARPDVVVAIVDVFDGATVKTVKTPLDDVAVCVPFLSC